MLVERANRLTLSVPEMTVLVGGMRALDANHGQLAHGVFTDRPGDPHQRLLREPARHVHGVEQVRHLRGYLRGKERATGKVEWTATPVDPIFGSNSELRPVTEVSAASDDTEKFVRDFARAWAGVMTLDRFDLED